MEILFGLLNLDAKWHLKLTRPALLNSAQQSPKCPKKLGSQSRDIGQMVFTTHKAINAAERGARRAVTV